MSRAAVGALPRRLTWRPSSGATWLPLLLIAGALLLWGTALPTIELAGMNDLGLVSVLPPAVFAALTLLTISFVLTLQRWERFDSLLLLHVLLLIFMLFGITALVEEVPRFSTTWRHVGIVDYVRTYGAVDPLIDAFFNWPGFFILAALLTELTGLESPVTLAAWSHVLFNLMNLGPLYLLFRAGTGDRRLLWLALWIFYSANWIGQDYFAPQAFAFFLYLTILAILLTWLRLPDTATAVHTRWQRAAREQGAERGYHPDEVAPRATTANQRVALLAVVLILYAAMVPSHQLTPFAVLATVTALAVTARIRPRTLPLLMGLMVGAWISYMTVTFLAGNLSVLTEPLGDVEQNVDANVTSRLGGSREHEIVLQVRLLMSVALWGLAGIGFLRRLVAGYWDLSLALVAALPFALLGLQAYGGELLLRVYLFALPGVAYFGAAALLPTPASGRGRWRLPLLLALLLPLLAAFQVARYGNERMDYFTALEVEAVHVLYEVAPPGSELIALSFSTPWRYESYDAYRYRHVERRLGEEGPEALPELLNREGVSAYLIVTRSQVAALELYFGFSEAETTRILATLERSPTVREIYRNADAVIFTGPSPAP